jgi:hypothetical protein
VEWDCCQPAAFASHRKITLDDRAPEHLRPTSPGRQRPATVTRAALLRSQPAPRRWPLSQ